MDVWLFLAHYFLAAKITIVIVVTVVRFVIVMVIFLVAVYKVVFNNFVAVYDVVAKFYTGKIVSIVV